MLRKEWFRHWQSCVRRRMLLRKKWISNGNFFWAAKWTHLNDWSEVIMFSSSFQPHCIFIHWFLLNSNCVQQLCSLAISLMILVVKANDRHMNHSDRLWQHMFSTSSVLLTHTQWTIEGPIDIVFSKGDINCTTMPSIDLLTLLSPASHISKCVVDPLLMLWPVACNNTKKTNLLIMHSLHSNNWCCDWMQHSEWSHCDTRHLKAIVFHCCCGACLRGRENVSVKNTGGCD